MDLYLRTDLASTRTLSINAVPGCWSFNLKPPHFLKVIDFLFVLKLSPIDIQPEVCITIMWKNHDNN